MLLAFRPAVDSTRRLLRIGIVLERARVRRHIAELLQEVQSSPVARVTMVLFTPRAGKPRSALLFDVYRRWDRARAGPTGGPMEELDLPEFLAAVPSAETTLGKPDVAPAWRADRQASLDVVLDLRTRRIGVPNVWARYGIWRLRYSDVEKHPRPPESFWEVVGKDPLSTGELVTQLDGESGERLLAQSVVSTTPGWSWTRNQQAVVAATDGLLVHKLASLHSRGMPALLKGAPARPAEPEPPIGEGPTNLEIAGWLAKTGTRRIKRWVVDRPVGVEWRLALRHSNQPLLGAGVREALSEFRWIDAQPGRWYADPFLVSRGGSTWAFFEDADRVTGHGRLAAAEVTPTGLSSVIPIENRPEHMSYPHVFRDGDEWFMIPETYDSRTIELLRCVEFPRVWKREAVLCQAPAVDSTLVLEQGSYWLFTTLRDPRTAAMQLWLFISSTLTGPWRPHPANPISADVRNARGAGAIERFAGKLYRPSQDCGEAYGRRFSLNEIVSLTPDDYEERPAVTVDPPPGFVGTHTYARCGAFELIDACALVPR